MIVRVFDGIVVNPPVKPFRSITSPSLAFCWKALTLREISSRAGVCLSSFFSTLFLSLADG